MLFFHRVGTGPSLVLAQGASTLNRRCKKVEIKSVLPEPEKKPEEGNLNRFAKHFFSKPQSKTDLLHRLFRSCVLAYVIVEAPTTWIGLNELAVNKSVGLAPRAVTNVSEFNNTEVLSSALEAELWGKTGPNPDYIPQYGPNCQITADVIGACLTPENIESLKSKVKITGYNLDKNNFYINAVVKINGKEISVNYDDLKTWRNITRDLLKHLHPEHTSGPDIIGFALEKALIEGNYGKVPNTLPSASSTLLIGRQYYTIPLKVLSDDHLVKILSDAPGTVIKVGTFPTFSDYKSIIGLQSNNTLYEEVPEDKLILPIHEYVVKNVREEHGEKIVTLKSFNPNENKSIEFETNLNNLRKTMISICAPSDSFKHLDLDSIKSILIGAILLLIMQKGVHCLEKKKSTLI